MPAELERAAPRARGGERAPPRVGSRGSPCARAKSLAVPVGITASGTPRPPRGSRAPGRPSRRRPPTTIRSGRARGQALEILGVAAAGVDLPPPARRPSPACDGRLGVEAAAGRGLRPGRCASGAPVHSPHSCSAASTTSASPSRTSTRPSRSTSRPTAMALVHRETVDRAGRRGGAARRRREPRRAAAPLGDDTPVGKFLAKKGPGLHHVAYQVADIEATLAALRDAGLRLIDETPRTGIRDSRVAFLHPAVDRRRAHRDRPARGGPH